MGANPTQAQAFALFLIAFVLLSAACATEWGVMYIIGFVIFFGASVALFLKCKPWEERED